MLDAGGEVVVAAGSTSSGPVGLERDLRGTRGAEGTEGTWFSDFSFSVDKAEPSRLFFLLPSGAKVRFGCEHSLKVCFLSPVTYTKGRSVLVVCRKCNG